MMTDHDILTMTTRSKGKSNSVSHESEGLNSKEQPTTADIFLMLKNLETTLNEVKRNQIKLENTLQTISSRMDLQHDEIKELQKSTNFLSMEIADISKSNSALLHKMEEQQRTIDDYTTKQSDLQRRLDDAERYSRGFNLRFIGIPEVDEPNKENCIQKIQELIHSRLQIKVDIENAHRVGKQLRDKPRPIIAKFIRRPERFSVLRQRFEFKKDEVMVFEDLIAKDFKARRNLAAVVQDARRQGKRTRFVKDTLFIDGRKYDQT